MVARNPIPKVDPRNLLGIQGAMFNWYTGGGILYPPYLVTTTSGVLQFLSSGGVTTKQKNAGVAQLVRLQLNQAYTCGLTVAPTAAGTTVTLSYAIMDASNNTAVGSGQVTAASGSTVNQYLVTPSFTTPVNGDIYIVLVITVNMSGNGITQVHDAYVIAGNDIPAASLPAQDSFATFDMRVAQIDPVSGKRLGTLYSVSEMQFGCPLSDVSALTFNYNSLLGDSSMFTNDFVELAVEVENNGGAWSEAPNGRMIMMTDNEDPSILGSDIQCSAVGFGWLLRKMTLTGNTVGGLNAAGQKQFTTATPGTIMAFVIENSHRNNEVSALLYDFNNNVDSAGTAWPTTVSMAFALGIDLYTILDNLVQQGLVDWYMSGRTLKMFVTTLSSGINNDLSASVIYRLGRDIISAPVTRDRSGIVSRVTVYGEAGVTTTLTGTTNVSPWGQLGTVINQGGVNDSATMAILAHGATDTEYTAAAQYTYGIDPKNTEFWPFFQYMIGDFITIATQTIQSLRCRTITISKTAANGVQLNLIMNTLIEELAIKQAKRTNGITNGAVIGGGGTPTLPVTQPDPATVAPGQVTGLVGAAATYLDVQNYTRNLASLSWTAPAGTVTSYEVYGTRKTPTGGVLKHFDSTPNLFATVSPFNPGEVWTFYVRAANNGVQGLASATVDVTMLADTTPPNVPDALTLTARLGVVQADWDGRLLATGSTTTTAPVPPDFNHLEVQIGTDPSWGSGSYIPLGDGTLLRAGSLVNGPSLVYNAVYFIRSRAVDNTGNVSPWSANQSFANTPLVNTDLIGQVVANANIVDGTIVASDKIVANSITTLLLAAGAITAGTIAANAITADKIVAGSIDTTKLTATAIDGMTITGATLRTAASGVSRVEINSTGLYQYDASNAVVSSWTPSAIQIVGTFRTGKVGTARVEMMNTTFTSNYGTYSGGGLTFYNSISYATQPSIVVDDLNQTVMTLGLGKITGHSSMRVQIVSDGGTQQGNFIVSALATGDDYNSSGTQLINASNDIDLGTQLLTAGPIGLQSAGKTNNNFIVLGPQAVGSPGNQILYNAQAYHVFDINFVQVMSISSGGAVFAGTKTYFASPNAMTNLNHFIQYDDSANNFLFSANALFTFQLNGTTKAILNAGGLSLPGVATTTAASNATLNGANNTIQKSTSLSKYKLDQKPIGVHYELLELASITWTDSQQLEDNPDTKIRHAGHTAEAVSALSKKYNGLFDSLIAFADDEATVLSGVDYERLEAFFIPILADMRKDILELKAAIHG